MMDGEGEVHRERRQNLPKKKDTDQDDGPEGTSKNPQKRRRLHVHVRRPPDKMNTNGMNLTLQSTNKPNSKPYDNGADKPNSLNSNNVDNDVPPRKRRLTEFECLILKLRKYLSQSPRDYPGKIQEYVQLIRNRCNCMKSREEVILRKEGMIGHLIQILRELNPELPENQKLIIMILSILGNCFSVDYGSREEQKEHGFLQILKSILSQAPNDKEIIYRAFKAFGNLLYQRDCATDALKMKLIPNVIEILESTSAADQANENILISGIRVLRIYGSGRGSDEDLKRLANTDGCTLFLIKILSEISIETTSSVLIIEILRTLIVYTVKSHEFCLLSRSEMSKTDNKSIGSLLKLLDSQTTGSKIYTLVLELIKNLVTIDSIALIFLEQKLYPILFSKLSTITTYSTENELRLIGLHLKVLQAINSSFSVRLLPINGKHGTDIGIETTFRFLHDTKFEKYHSFLWTLYSKLPQWYLKKLYEQHELVKHIEQSFKNSYGIVKTFEEVCQRTLSVFQTYYQDFFCEKHNKWVNSNVTTCIPEPDAVEEPVSEVQSLEQSQDLVFSPQVDPCPSPVYSSSSGGGCSPGSSQEQDSDGGYSPISSPLPPNEIDDEEEDNYSDTEDLSFDSKISRWGIAAKRLPNISPNDTQTLHEVQHYLKIEILFGILETVKSIYYLQIPEIESLIPSIFSLLLNVTVVCLIWKNSENLQKLQNGILKICNLYLDYVDVINLSLIIPIIIRCYLMSGRFTKTPIREKLKTQLSKHYYEFSMSPEKEIRAALLNTSRNRIPPHFSALILELEKWDLRPSRTSSYKLEELFAALCILNQEKEAPTSNESIPTLIDDVINENSSSGEEEEMITLCLDDNSKLIVAKHQLLSLSPVFESMFSGNFSESSQQFVTLRNMSLQAATFLFHTDKKARFNSSDEIDLKLCIELLSISQQYLISNIYRAVCNFIVTHHLCSYNAPWLYTECLNRRFSQMDQHERLDSKSLRLQALSFILNTPQVPYAVRKLMEISEAHGLYVIAQDLKCFLPTRSKFSI